jgi:triosephosphate isomerase
VPGKTLIVGNWKMNGTLAQSRELVRALLADSSWRHPDVDVAVAPPFTALAAVAAELGANSPLGLGAQTMHWAERGAYTGEISPVMLVEIGCRYVILGHSERRGSCGETDLGVNLKTKSALAHGLVPVVAVGETLEEHNSGRTAARVTEQVRAALDGLDAGAVARCVLAYEPLWAIGTGVAEDPATADAVMATIRGCDPALADVQILYGGSVKPENVASFVAQPNIDGALVGGASLDARTFSELVRNARPAVARA